MIKKFKANVPTYYKVVADIDILSGNSGSLFTKREFKDYAKAKYAYRALNEVVDGLFENEKVRGYIVLKAVCDPVALTIERVYWDNEENKEGGDKCLTK